MLSDIHLIQSALHFLIIGILTGQGFPQILELFLTFKHSDLSLCSDFVLTMFSRHEHTHSHYSLPRGRFCVFLDGTLAVTKCVNGYSIITPTTAHI